MKTVFLGTPEIAVPFLKRLSEGHEVAFVVSGPDRSSGRGMHLTPCAVKREALSLGIKVLGPERPSLIAGELAAVRPELGVVVAYGKMLKKDVLSVPRLGFINIHFSLLPKYRGGAPVPWVLMRGEEETGVTSFWLDKGMDTGPIFIQKAERILPEDNAATLFERLIRTGVEVMNETLENIASGRIIRRPQALSVGSPPPLAPCLTKDDSWLDFGLSAQDIHNKVRGLYCGPRARVRCRICGRKVMVQVLKTSLARPCDLAQSTAFKPGTIVRIEMEKGFFVKCVNGSLLVEEVQPEGKRQMSARDFLNGYRLKLGDLFAICKRQQ